MPANAVSLGECYCGPPVFSESALWQMCSVCLEAGCPVGGQCRIGRDLMHPAPEQRHNRLLTRRQWAGKYRQVRCALCYRRFWPWQRRRVQGANYFPHPWMACHHGCALDFVTGRERPA